MGSAAPPAGALKPRRFISQIVRSQIRTQAVFRCGQSPTLVWSRCTSSERRELAQRMHVVCDTTEESLKVEFAEKGLQQSTACFDITMFQDAWAEGAAPLLKNKLRNMARMLSRGWGTHPSRFVTEWEELVPLILERARALEYRVDEVGKADNLSVWSGAVLESTWLAEEFPARPAPFIEIQAIVRRWVAIGHSGE